MKQQFAKYLCQTLDEFPNFTYHFADSICATDNNEDYNNNNEDYNKNNDDDNNKYDGNDEVVQTYFYSREQKGGLLLQL